MLSETDEDALQDDEAGDSADGARRHPGPEDRVVSGRLSLLEPWARRRASTWLERGGFPSGTGRCHCSPIEPMHLLHGEGIREAADLVIDHGSNVRGRGRPFVPPELLAPHLGRLKDGAVVHVKTDHLPVFVERLLPRIEARIVLVTGDSDACAVARHEALLEHPTIAHWFAQNCDVSYRHPRLTRLPIGIDNPVFDKMGKRAGFLLTMLLGRTPFDPSVSRNDMGDQAVLRETRRSQERGPLERPARVLCTFQNNGKLLNTARAVPDRRQALAAVSGRAWAYVPRRRLRQRTCWAIHDRFAFELSPRGWGLDCLRTWEALYLRTIPIVRSSTLDPLYRDEGYPVAIVEDWREIDADRLEQWRSELGPRFDEALDHRLSLDHWLRRIREQADAARRA